jgi:hypothetical protein
MDMPEAQAVEVVEREDVELVQGFGHQSTGQYEAKGCAKGVFHHGEHAALHEFRWSAHHRF